MKKYGKGQAIADVLKSPLKYNPAMGWKGESTRHSMAAKGILTARKPIHTRKWDRCIEDVKMKGSARNPYAVCTKAMGSESFLHCAGCNKKGSCSMYALGQKKMKVIDEAIDMGSNELQILHGDNLEVYYENRNLVISHYGTKILEVDVNAKKVIDVGGYSRTDQTIINYTLDKLGIKKRVKHTFKRIPFDEENPRQKNIKDEKITLESRGKGVFRANKDDKMHEGMFEKDEEETSKKLNKAKIDYLINDEHKAKKEYNDLGLETLSHDEARHEHLLKTLKEERKKYIASDNWKNKV